MQCKQFKIQLRLGQDLANYGKETELRPMRLDRIVWWDEKHQKIRLGPQAKHEAIVSRDPATFEMKAPRDGGEFGKRRESTTVKYPEEARFAFGAAMRTTADGKEEGVKCEPFEYTSLTLLGPKKFNEKVRAEVDRAKRLACTGKKGVWKAGGYKERYGDRIWLSAVADDT